MIFQSILNILNGQTFGWTFRFGWTGYSKTEKGKDKNLDKNSPKIKEHGCSMWKDEEENNA